MKIVGFNPFRPSRKRSSGGHPVAQAAFRDVLPKAADVVVIGGGIAGLATAIELADRGQRVVVLEKGRLGAEQTSRALGWVASIGDSALNLPLSLASKALWRGFRARHGLDNSFEACGITLLCKSDHEMAALETWRENARHIGAVDARPLTRAEIAERMPYLRMSGLAGAWHQASDGRVVPARVAPILAEVARRLGVVIAENCAARIVETEAGKVSHVVTENGVIGTQAAVIAGGAWSRRILQQHGIAIPQLQVYGALYRTGQVISGLSGGGSTGSLGWLVNADGSLTFGTNTVVATVTPDSLRLLRPFLPALLADHGKVAVDVDEDFWHELRQSFAGRDAQRRLFERNRILGASADERTGRKLLDMLRRELPDLATARVEQSWGGVIDVTPDRAPILGQTRVSGLYLCTGFSSHGLAMAPAAAVIVSDLIVGRVPSIDASAYALARFQR